MELVVKVLGSIGVISMFSGMAFLDSTSIVIPAALTGLGLILLITSALIGADLWNYEEI